MKPKELNDVHSDIICNFKCEREKVATSFQKRRITLIGSVNDPFIVSKIVFTCPYVSSYFVSINYLIVRFTSIYGRDSEYHIA